MPRAFSEAERTTIEAKLAAAGLEQFSQHGLRRTNVASLCRAAGIAKGSFYLFFPSKEALLASLMEASNRRTREQLDSLVADPNLAPRDRVERFLRQGLDAFANDPLRLRLRDPEEAEALRRSLPANAVANQEQAEDAYFVGVLQEWQDAGELTPMEPEAMLGLVRALRAVGLERESIGEARFDRTCDLLVAALADSLAW